MKLLVVVLCLLSERYLMHTYSYQRFSWFGKYSDSIKKHLETYSFLSNPYAVLAALVLPIILGVGVIYWTLNGILFGLLGLILSIFIFYYCLGPQNVFYPSSPEDLNQTSNEFVSNYFVMANSQLFAVLFWYLIAGPIAALTYRVVTLCEKIDGVSQQSIELSQILEWIPARITALLFLLVGNFQKGISSFLKYAVAKPESNKQILSFTGLMALGADEKKEITVPSAEALVEHSAILFLVLIALFTLAAWL